MKATLLKPFLFLLGSFTLLCFTKSETPFSPNTTLPEKPNILFIEVDDLTAKYLGCFGARFAQTNCVDELAQNGTVFVNAVCQGVMCTPSRNSLITTKYPHELGLFENLDLKKLPKGIWTFPKALRKEGYYNYWVGKNHLIPDCRGLGAENPVDMRIKGMKAEMGFDDVYESLGRSVMREMILKTCYTDEGWIENIESYGDFLFDNNLIDAFLGDGFDSPTKLDPNYEYMDGYFTTIALEKLQQHNTAKPFFMWVNFSGPHVPFDAPKEYQDLFDADLMSPYIEPSEEILNLPSELLQESTIQNPEHIALNRKKYAATIAYMDEQVGRITTYIKNSAFKNNTIIVFFSDHGIMTGDQCLTGKNTLFKEVLNPALIISYPEHFKVQRVETAVELLDLGKTVLDIAGASKKNLDRVPNGSSLVPILSGNGTFEGDGYGLSEMRHFQSLFDGTYKYIHNSELPILFNLKVDADETQNRIDLEPEVADRLKKIIEKS